jgi:hypothetical protein
MFMNLKSSNKQIVLLIISHGASIIKPKPQLKISTGAFSFNLSIEELYFNGAKRPIPPSKSHLFL